MDRQRRKGVTIRKPIVSGSYACMLSKQEIDDRLARDDRSTHSWVCSVRAPDCEDQSYFIRRVHFTLHPSFANPNRLVESPPFSIREEGWGEFDVIIRIVFVDPNERPVELKHGLRLYESGVDIRTVKADTHRRLPPIVSENFNEVIFQEPTDTMYEALIRGPSGRPITYEHQDAFLKHDESSSEYVEDCVRVATDVHREIDELKLEVLGLSQKIRQLKTLYFQLRPEEAASLLHLDWRPCHE